MKMQQIETLKQRGRNWKNNHFFAIMLFFSMIIFGCTHEIVEPCTSLRIKYQTDIRPIVSSNCSSQGCHNNSGTIGNFNNYEELKAKCDDGSLERRVFWKADMPPSPMDTCDLIKLKKWFTEGYKRK